MQADVVMTITHTMFRLNVFVLITVQKNVTI